MATRASEVAVPQRPAIYLRISEDRAGDELGVARQEKHCRLLGERRGWNMADVEVYVDNDISAARKAGHVAERPDYERLRVDIETGDRDGVLAYDLDRLLRDPMESEQFWLLCEQVGMYHIVTEADSIDISTGYGLMVARIKAAVAAEEVRKIRQRVTDKKLELAERGMPAGGGMRALGWSCYPRATPPGCYRRGCDHGPECQARLDERARPCTVPGCRHDRGMSLVPAEADGLCRAAVMILAGETQQAAVDMLTAAGVTAVGGGVLEPTVLRRLLLSPRIAGLRQHQGAVIGPAAWPAILDRSTWERLRAVLSDRHTYTAPYREHLLSGIARCVCGRHLTAQVTTRAGQSGPVVYSCRSRFGGCGRLSITAARLEQSVVDEVGDWLDDDDLAAEITALLVGNDGHDLDALDAQIAADEAELAVIARQRSELGLELAEWQALRQPVKQRLDAARAERARLYRRTAASTTAGAVTVGELVDAWGHGDRKMQRHIIATLATVTVLPAGKKWRAGATGYETPDRVQCVPVWES